MVLAFSNPQKKYRDRRNQAGGRGNGEAREVLPAVGGGFSFVIRRRGVEAGETQRTAREINQRHDPAGGSKFLKHNPVNQKRGCDAERNDVGQRIKFATERAFVPSQTRQPPVQKIENESAENEPDRFMKAIGRGISVRALQKRAFQNLERGGEATKQVSGRH